VVSIIFAFLTKAAALSGTLSALRTQEYRNWNSSSSTRLNGWFRRIDPAIQSAGFSANSTAGIQSEPRDELGMQAAQSQFGIFSTPMHATKGPDWLRPLATALFDPKVAAVFGRQIPRPDCRAVYCVRLRTLLWRES